MMPNCGSGSSAWSRREFLARTGATAAGVLAGLEVSRTAHAAGSDIIKVGMIGCGGRCSGAAAQALNTGPDVRLVAMCDIFESKVKAARENLKNIHPDKVIVDDDHCFVGLDGYKKVIEASDVVLIACASKFHPMYSEEAIKAGKHVFVEKPHGIDPVGVRRMQAACDLAKEKGLSIVSGLQSRFDFGWQECMKRIHDGAIGDIVAVQAMFLRGPYQVMSRKPEHTELQFQFWNWYHFCWLSGDDVPQSLVHNMDRVSWALKEEMPEWCFGLGGRSASFGEGLGDMYDHDTVVYEYKSGARVYAMCRTQNGCYGNSSDIIMGTKGTCYLGQKRIVGETNWQYEGPRNDPYQTEQQALFDSIRKGQPINSGYHMAQSTMVTVLGQLAVYTGQAMRFEEVAKMDFQYRPTPEETRMDMEPPTLPDSTGNYPLPKPGISSLEWIAGPRRP
ncbi:Gfo/Idh/MocA family oxidoreductase [Thermogutta sp.]|uniref:Gfo/Idh/MocA family oxidoreductase n=1 Tax=Thermogutta sp. TaxID=1962930 RepID=UPI00321F6268